MSMANFHKVEEKLGKQAVKLLLDSARNGDISDDQMDCIADLLGRQPDPSEPNDVFGRHRQRMDKDRDKDWHIMLKYILCDWWLFDLFELTNEKALEKLVNVCQDSNVALRPLAKALKDIRDAQSKNQVIATKKISFIFQQLLMKVPQNYLEEAEKGEDTLPSIHPNPQGMY